MSRRCGSTPTAPSTLVAGTALKKGDRVLVQAGEVIPGDGDVVEGVASVDESAITGESAPVIREAGGDRSAVTGGTKVLSDQIVVEITSAPGETFLDRMIALVEGASRRKTPNEIALSILLVSLTIVFLLAVATLRPMADYAGAPQSTLVLVALLVCLIPTTIGALLSAIGIAGMDRLVRVNVLAMSGRAVEAAGDVSTLLLDKTGTITYGNRQASRFVPAEGVTAEQMRDAARLSSLADQTPEGRSIVELALAEGADDNDLPVGAEFVEFTAQTRMSGVDLADGRTVRKGAGSSVAAWVGRDMDPGVRLTIDEIAGSGGTPLVVAESNGQGAKVLGVVHLKDVVKEGMTERFAELRRMGIRTVMITGDNPLTAASIAAEAGVDDFLAEATPEDKMKLIHKEQEGGRLVAMTGDGTNDAPALAAADVGVAMNSGTSAAKEAGNMVDLDSDPTKLIDIVAIGKQLLITRGALTTFSIANDVAKYFAIIPAMFLAAYPSLDSLNVMKLSTPTSAITSAVIFNALVIVALIPLALEGGQVPRGLGRVGPAPQHLGLRRRWRHRTVHRDQAHRPHRLDHPRNRITHEQRLHPPKPRRPQDPARHDRGARGRVPRSRVGRRAGRVPRQGERPDRVAGRQGRRLGHHRPELQGQGSPVVPRPALGRGLRRAGLGRRPTSDRPTRTC